MKIERTKIQVLDQMTVEIDALGCTASKLVSELSVNGVDIVLDDAYDWMLKVAELRRAMKAVRGAFYANNIRGLIDMANNGEDDIVTWYTTKSNPKYELVTCYMCHHFYEYIQILGIDYDTKNERWMYDCLSPDGRSWMEEDYVTYLVVHPIETIR